jgi:hypothetical protein
MTFHLSIYTTWTVLRAAKSVCWQCHLHGVHTDCPHRLPNAEYQNAIPKVCSRSVKLTLHHSAC